MPSPAAEKFEEAQKRADRFCELTRDRRIRPMSREHTRTFLHAALATYVAGWESYVERLVVAFVSETSNPLVADYQTIHSLLASLSERAKDKFHTPNWENSRELLITYTGYDPINDWIWPRRGMSGPLVRTRLNQILQVRHSFAHGYTMPSYDWNTSSTGEVRLTTTAVIDADKFMSNLVTRTDAGMRQYIRSTFNPHLAW